MKLFKTKYIILLIVGTLFLLFGSVWAFSRPAIFDCFSLSAKKSEIGYAINGMTAPITSLIGSILIFLSLFAQVKANSLIQAQWSYDTFVRLFNDIQSEFSNLKYTDHKRPGNTSAWTMVSYSGSEAISNFIGRIEIESNNKSIGILNDISFILEDLRALIEDIDKSDIFAERKLFLIHRINRFYTSKIQIPIVTIHLALSNSTNKTSFNYYISSFDLIEKAINDVRIKFITNPKK